MPIEVSIINTTSATVKYDFIRTGICFQFVYSHDATTSLDASKAPPIIIIGIGSAAKIAINPAIAYHAAIVDSDSAEINSKYIMYTFPLSLTDPEQNLQACRQYI